ncbi:MAG: KGG domain-containing protein [Oligoflexales bacterium]
MNIENENKETTATPVKHTKGTGKGRGFASMDPEEQRRIASKGGKAAHRSGNAHEFTSEEARAAGRKGGLASKGERKLRANIAANRPEEIAKNEREPEDLDREQTAS